MIFLSLSLIQKIIVVGMGWLFGKWKFFLVLVPFLVFLYAFVHEGIEVYQKVRFREQRSKEVESLLRGEDGGGVSIFFVDDIRNGINDEYTKKSAYLVFQRYIVSGNIYELYDYVSSHTEFDFLEEAENLYPESFEKVRKRRLPFHHTDDGMYVYLAYLEILEKHGYGNEDILSSLAYRYAQMAYYKKMINKDKERGESLEYPDYTMDMMENDIRKSVFFANKIDDWIRIEVDDGMKEKAASRDSLENMVQYAATLRYLESLGVDFVSTKKSEEIFSSVSSYSYRFIPDMYLEVSLMNAATLLLVPSSSAFEIRNAIFPFLDYRVRDTGLIPVVGKMLRSRVEAEHARYLDLSIYSKRTMISLSERVPEFREWLIMNGWHESDF